MLSQRHWLQNFSTLLSERERSLDSWQQLVGKVIPGPRRRVFRNLMREIWVATEEQPLLQRRDLMAALRASPRFAIWWEKGPTPLPPALETGKPAPLADISAWRLPPIENQNELSELLSLHPDDLGWLISNRYHHYHEQWLAKRRGGRRLLESPKPLLKSTQRTLLEKILNHIPPHEAATGFRAGKSIIDFASPHTSKGMVLKMDLAQFFPSIGRARIKHTFMALGYRESVAYALASLTTTSSRRHDLSTSEGKLYQRFHLPQGAPTSPALANLVVFRLDCRLAGLAKAAGANYTRYADDLLFSGSDDFARQVRRFEIKIMAIALEEGLSINARKTRTMPSSQRQSAAGLILNKGINARRAEYDRLKAILHNCARHGIASQNQDAHPNFEAHLRGRVEWLATLNPNWGEKLRAALQAIPC